MGLNNKRKKYVKIDRETGSDDILTLFDDVNIQLEDDIDNLTIHSNTEESVLKVSLKNELESDYEPLNLLVSKANQHVVKYRSIKKTQAEGSSKVEKEIKGKRKRNMK